MAMSDAELEGHKRAVAERLRALERALERFAEALSHAERLEVVVNGAAGSREALRQVADAYMTIEHVTDADEPPPAAVMGVIGVPREVKQRAERVNAAKDALKEYCKQLGEEKKAVSVKNEAGKDAPTLMPVMRLILRDLGRPRLNLLAAYRKIPILEKPPVRVSYVKAITQAVYCLSKEEVLELLEKSSKPGVEEDRARVQKLPRGTELALVRKPYENLRANVRLSSANKQNKIRVQVRAELPLLYQLPARGGDAPEVSYGGGAGRVGGRRERPRYVEEEPFLNTQPIHRYQRKPDERRTRAVRSAR